MRKKHSDSWRFSDYSNRFDGKRQRRTRRTGVQPLSPALSRGVIHCKRCGTRVVSNLDHCPFCGCALQPLYKRFWFWLIIIVILAAGVAYLLFVGLPRSYEPIAPDNTSELSVVGSPESANYKNLPLTTVVSSGLVEATVVKSEDGPTTASGQATIALHVQVVNKSENSVTLYSTQWRIENKDGTRIDSFLGPAADGTPIDSSFETYELLPGQSLEGTLYFASAAAKLALYQPNPLDFKEETLVTWEL